MDKQVNESVKVTIEFYNFQNRPTAQPSELGKPIYKWEYKNADGKVIAEQMNVQEMIQSYEHQCDFKTRIKQGEIFDGEDNYMDISELPADVNFATLGVWLNKINADYNKLLEESKKAQSNGQSNSEDNKDGTVPSVKASEGAVQAGQSEADAGGTR